MSCITTQLYLPSNAKKCWGCPKISTDQRSEIQREGPQRKVGEELEHK